MLTVDKTVRIEAPLTRVYAYISHHENYTNWFPGMGKIKSADKFKDGTLGKTYFEHARMPSGRYREMITSVVDAEVDSRFKTESAIPLFKTRMAVYFKKHSASETEVRWTFASRNKSAFINWLFNKLMGTSLNKSAEQGLEKLKQILELEKRD